MKKTLNPYTRYRKPRAQIIIPDRVAERAATRYEKADDGCWISTYSVASHGYAQIGWQGGGRRHVITAHRAAWVHANGRQIEEGHTIDHLCKNRRCVNPEHLRSLPNFENARRTSRRDWPLGTCVHGHPNSELVEQGGKLVCRVCAREWQRRYREKLRQQVAARGRYHPPNNQIRKEES